MNTEFSVNKSPHVFAFMQIYFILILTSSCKNLTFFLWQVLFKNPSCSFQGYDNQQSSVRKASVFCLVAIYQIIGEDLRPHIQELSGSKVNIYLQEQEKSFFKKTGRR